MTENNWDDLSFYDETGANPKDFKERFDAAGDYYDALVDGAVDRIKRNLVDLTGRAGFQLTGRRNSRNKYDWASEYYNYDWEYAQTPEVWIPAMFSEDRAFSHYCCPLKQSSWMETANNDIYTFDPEIGFGDETLLCIDQRGMSLTLPRESPLLMMSTGT